jgi:dTMP kinase
MQKVLQNFIVLEGLDGAGTTTQMKNVVEVFDQHNINCHATFEPTSSPLGTLVRSILRKEIVTTPLALALLFSADREDHLNHPITGLTQRLDNGEIVISDRYFFSSLAYQSVDCGYDKVLSINNFPYPEYIFYLDTPIEDCLSRIDSRKEEKEIFEQQDFLTKVKSNYDKVFSHLPEGVKCICIDGTKSKESITAEIIEHLQENNLL